MHTAQREAAERDRRASRRASSDLQQQTMKESQAEGKRRKGKEKGDDDDTEALTTQDRRKRQKCLQLSASETATASSSSSQAVHPPEALQLWDLVVTSIHSSDPAYPAYLFSYWADWAQDPYKRPLS